MKHINAGLSIFSVVLLASTSMGSDDCELNKLPADIDNHYYFGSSASISGDVAVIGATGSDVDGNDSAGAAYVYVRSGSEWMEEAKLFSQSMQPQSQFGRSVSISGDTIVVGDEIAEEAHIFIRDGSGWTDQATLSAPTAPGSGFGCSVAVDDDTILVGANLQDVNGQGSVGRVYQYQRSGTNWFLQSIISPNNPEAGDLFGTAVDLDGDLAVVGAMTNSSPSDVDSGSAYIFVRNGNSWEQEAWLVPDDIDRFDYFGASVAIDNGTVVVGAAMHDYYEDLSYKGSAYVFVRETEVPITWRQSDKIIGLDTSSNSAFGWCVDILDDTIIVGARNNRGSDQGPRAGSAYIFQNNDGDSWNQISKLYFEGGEPDDWFGYSVALGNQSAVVGSHFDTEKEPFMPHAGGAYFYCGDWIEDNSGTDCPGDSTGDNVVNVNDLLAVINVWGNCPDCVEDVTGDGVINVDDVLLILSNFGQECP